MCMCACSVLVTLCRFNVICKILTENIVTKSCVQGQNKYHGKIFQYFAKTKMGRKCSKTIS